MKAAFQLAKYFIFLSFLMSIFACKKDELTKVTKLETGTITNITYTTATANATFTDLSGNVTAFGHCWNTSGNPSTIDSKSTASGTAKKGDFSSNLTGLSAGTKYYLKAYAIDGGTPVYGNQVEFSTNAYELPFLTTEAVTSITYTGAISGGSITSDGGREVTGRGVCWSTSQNPTITDSKTNNGTGTGTFSSNLTGLTANTSYYVRAYATNSEGSAYGNQQNFTTNAYDLPTVTTSEVASVTYNSAVSGGNVTTDGGSAVTAKGVCWSTSQNPTIADEKTNDGTGIGSFTSNLTGLSASESFYVRAYATNSQGTAYGNERNFTTSVAPNITITSPTTGDHWLGLESKNIIWSTNLSGNVSISLYKGSSLVTEIVSNTENDGTYTWSSVSDDQFGTDYKICITSLEMNNYFAESAPFTISESNGSTGTIVDINFNSFKTVKIGYQWWMAENLYVTYYNDNTGSLPNVTDHTEWTGLTTPAYCWYDNNLLLYKETYGALYNWYAVETGKLCPAGWHIPDKDEFDELINYLGGLDIAGGKLKEQGIVHWNTPNEGATNESGFTALPGGWHWYSDPPFFNINEFGTWWCTTEEDETSAYFLALAYNHTYANIFSQNKKIGMSVRCVRD